MALACCAGGCLLPSYESGQGGSGAGGSAATGNPASTTSGADGGTGGTATGGATGGTGGATGGTGMGGATSTTTGSGGSDELCMGGKTCKPTAPAGWDYVHHIEADFSAAAPGPTCPDGSAPAQYFKDPTPSDCTPCSCGWTGATCSQPEISCYYGTTTCAGAPAFSITPDDSMCIHTVDIPKNGQSTASCQITMPAKIQANGTCFSGTPQQENLNAWLKEVHVCTAQADRMAACPDGQCVIDGAEPYTGSVCIAHQGNQACPGDWPTKTLVYTSEDDTRACSPCTCGNTAITCNVPSYSAYNDDECAGLATSFAGDACASVGSKFSGDMRSLKPPVVTASVNLDGCYGGMAQGAVTPQDPWTICCEPAP
jgi:hypothetical protein